MENSSTCYSCVDRKVCIHVHTLVKRAYYSVYFFTSRSWSV